MARWVQITLLIISLTFAMDCMARQCSSCFQMNYQPKKVSCHEQGVPQSKSTAARCCFFDQADQTVKNEFDLLTSFTVSHFIDAVTPLFGKITTHALNYHFKRYRDAFVPAGTMRLKLKQSFLI